MNRTADFGFTIIVPVYNEAENMPALARRLADYVQRSSQKACVLFVDDGSTDASFEAIRTACGLRDDFFYLKLERNGGLSAALKAGIDATRSEYVGYIDADLQTSPDDFELLLPRIADHDVSAFADEFFRNADIPTWLLAWGMAGQTLFTLRFVYQLVYSRRRHESTLPQGFWLISLAGSAVIAAYAIVRCDAVLIVGQSFGMVAYVRNLSIGAATAKT